MPLSKFDKNFVLSPLHYCCFCVLAKSKSEKKSILQVGCKCSLKCLNGNLNVNRAQKSVNCPTLRVSPTGASRLYCTGRCVYVFINFREILTMKHKVKIRNQMMKTIMTVMMMIAMMIPMRGITMTISMTISMTITMTITMMTCIPITMTIPMTITTMDGNWSLIRIQNVKELQNYKRYMVINYLRFCCN